MLMIFMTFHFRRYFRWYFRFDYFAFIAVTFSLFSRFLRHVVVILLMDTTFRHFIIDWCHALIPAMIFSPAFHLPHILMPMLIFATPIFFLSLIDTLMTFSWRHCSAISPFLSCPAAFIDMPLLRRFFFFFFFLHFFDFKHYRHAFLRFPPQHAAISDAARCHIHTVFAIDFSRHFHCYVYYYTPCRHCFSREFALLPFFFYNDVYLMLSRCHLADIMRGATIILRHFHYLLLPLFFFDAFHFLRCVYMRWFAIIYIYYWFIDFIISTMPARAMLMPFYCCRADYFDAMPFLLLLSTFISTFSPTLLITFRLLMIFHLYADII